MFMEVSNLIEIKNLYKTYKTGDKKVEALKNINLTISDGDIFGIVGLSGAGKSSLVRCVNLLEKPDSGEILIDGEDITKFKKSKLRESRKKIGMIFQHFNLLMNSTVYENIALPLKFSGKKDGYIKKRVNELLEVVELSDKSKSYPAQLSGGQKQRVAIARALANNPQIILSDEATSALDPATTDSILSLLKSINEKLNITILIITHEMDVIKKICSKVAVMENGEIVEEGNILDVISNPKTKVAKSFLGSIDSKLPKDVIEEVKKDEKLIKITFLGNSTEEPVISNIIKNFDIEVSILSGNIENVQNTKIGSLIIKISGNSEALKKSQDYLASNGVRIEVLK